MDSPNEVKEIPKRVERFIKQQCLIDTGEKVVVAVSGGVDSMVLLDILIRLSKKIGFSIHVAHLDHGLRESSERDAKFVERKCKTLSLPYTIERRKVQKEKGESIEEAARRTRYKFLEDVKKSVGASKIATAHHLNDLVETIIYRLIRGTGPLNVVGMMPKRDGIIRPLLFLTRDEIESYAKNMEISYTTDETNYDLTIRRNFIRHRIVPLMKVLNPSVEKAFYRFSQISWLLKNFVDDIISNYLDKFLSKHFHGVEVDMTNDSFLLTEILKKTFEDLTGRIPEHEKIMKVLERMDERAFKEEFYSGWGVWKYGNKIFVGNLKPRYVEFSLEEGDFFIGDFKILVSRDKIEGSIGFKKIDGMMLRTRKRGDRVKGKKLKDFLIEKKVPAYLRDALPIVAIERLVIYIPEIYFDKRYEGNDIYIKFLKMSERREGSF